MRCFKFDQLSSVPRSVTTQDYKLPKLVLPTFNGDPLNYHGFRDQFNASIHLNENLSDIDSFNYLKRYFGGKALNAVSGLSLSSEDYKEAVELLNRRFGDHQVLISAQMELLLKLKKLKSFDSNRLMMLNSEVRSPTLRCVRYVSKVFQKCKKLFRTSSRTDGPF